MVILSPGTAAKYITYCLLFVLSYGDNVQPKPLLTNIYSPLLQCPTPNCLNAMLAAPALLGYSTLLDLIACLCFLSADAIGNRRYLQTRICHRSSFLLCQ